MGAYNTYGVADAAPINPIEWGEHADISGVKGKKVFLVGSNGSQISSFGLITTAHDYIGVTYPDTLTEVFTYKTGGSGGTTVGVITVVYSDPVTKQIITSVTKT